MNLPIRIQRKRTAGFRLQAQSPDGRPVVSVTRGTKYGNPFKVGCWAGIRADKRGNAWPAVADKFSHDTPCHIQTAAQAVEMYRRLALASTLCPLDLVGKHLACYCQPGEPCHADVLLSLAAELAPAS